MKKMKVGSKFIYCPHVPCGGAGVVLIFMALLYR